MTQYPTEILFSMKVHISGSQMFRESTYSLIESLQMTPEEFNRLPLLSSHFPITFQSGGRWDSFRAHCGTCSKQAPDRMFRGTIESIPTSPYRSTPGDSVRQVNAFVLCLQCNVLTPVRYRLYPDMSVVSFNSSEFLRWTPHYSFWSQLRKFFRNQFR